MTAPRVTRLGLQDFRSYRALDLTIDAGLVALVGENGAGKTNLLESLSLFCPGRGLRRADWSSLPHRDGGGGFAISLELDGGEHYLGLGAMVSGDDGPPSAWPGSMAKMPDRRPISPIICASSG